MPTPRKEKTVAMATGVALPPIPSDWLDKVVTGPMTAGAVESLMHGFIVRDNHLDRRHHD